MKKSIFLIKTFKINNIDIVYNNINFCKDFFSFRSIKKRYISLYFKFSNIIFNDKKINNIITKGYNNYIKLKGLNICYFGYESSSFFKKRDKFNILSKIILLKPFKRIIFDKILNYIFFIYKIKNNKNEIKKSIIEIYNFFKISTKKKNKKIKVKIKYNNNYTENFKKIKKLILSGEIMQIQLGCKYLIKNKILNINNLYYKIIKYNINELSYLFSYKNNKMIINSPETFLKNYNFLEMFPIAGTIKRGRNILTDKILERKLLKDNKENSEHNMLIDMTRNDLFSIKKNFCCEKISKKKIGKFFFLQHIISNVKLENERDFFNSILKTFPAGTLTGSPKFKAMKIIKRIENYNREFYGGIIGFYSKNIFNMTIIIRTILLKKNKIFFQAASGIVKDSTLKYEKIEISNKIRTIINILNFI
ncbi:chorismate-binding protein [Candidatus Vidania fulgoroideorum]